MVTPIEVAVGQSSWRLCALPWPLPLGELTGGGDEPWEVELGFGKGRYLLRRAQEEAGRTRFLGVEMAAKYFRLARDRARKMRLRNLVLIRGEALYLLCAVLPAGFASTVHVYFPDPWPKDRHAGRRLFDAGSVDLVLRLLEPGGRLLFATDHPAYGEAVSTLLASCAGVGVTVRDGVWEDGPRTNYEAKYAAEGRSICRLEATVTGAAAGLHPRGRPEVVAAPPGAGEPAG